MSTSVKIVIGIVAVVVVFGGIWFVIQSQIAKAPESTSTESVPIASVPSTPAVQDTSDTALNDAVTNLDIQINALAADSAQVDQGLNDQAISQQ